MEILIDCLWFAALFVGYLTVMYLIIYRIIEMLEDLDAKRRQ